MPTIHDMQCEVTSLVYDAANKRGILRVAAGTYCDMAACTALFEAIDPAACRIETYSGDLMDWVYLHQDGRDWEAVHPSDAFL